jgi:beta-lactamase regulating signal transducer with metallopeptidase domain
MDATALSFTLSTVSDPAAEMAVAALWQGVLVAGALALFLRIMPRISAAYRFAAWTAAFVALVCLSLFSQVPMSVANATQAMQAKVIASKPWIIFDARWSLVIAGLWLAVSLFRAADLVVHSLRLRRLWKDARPVQLDERVEALLAGAAANRRRGRVEVCTTSTLQRPSVIGFFRPRILIPDWLFARLTQGELEQIVLHEVEHLRRRDDWTNLVQKLCIVLFPLNPALMWVERRLCREREMACDEAVVRVTRAPRAYAACLASMAERGLERRVEALSLGAWQRRPELVHRVHSILRSKGMLSPANARMLVGSLGCSLLAGSVVLGRSPQLVAFVPVRDSVAASEAKNVNPTKPAQIQSASIEPVTVRSRIADAVLSRPMSANEPPTAMDVTLREPSAAGTISFKAPASRERSDGAPKQVLAKAKRYDATFSQGEQLLVFTEWEQVETTSDNAGLKSDYDIDTAKNDAPALRDQQPSGRVTITQLIFKVSPTSAGSSSATKPGTSPSSNQPGIAAFRDGWFVLQL